MLLFSHIEKLLRYLFHSIDYMTGPDLGLSNVEFGALVRKLLTSLSYLPWIWRGAESRIILILYVKKQCVPTYHNFK